MFSNAAKVTAKQSSDITVGKSLRGGLLGAVVNISTGPLVGLAAAGSAEGAAYGALRDTGVSDKMMKLAGKQLEAGQAAVSVLAEDKVAHAIESAIRDAGVGDIEVGSFPAEAESVVKKTLEIS